MPRPTALRAVCVVWASVWLGACGPRSAATPPSADPPAPPPASTQPAPDPPVPLVASVPSTVGSVRPGPDAAEPDEPAEIEPPVEADCALVPAPGAPIRAVALTDRVDPSHAPRPTNDSERLLFRQLYDTLVRIDCEGGLVPGLATRWRLNEADRTWIVTLDEQARFTDGRPVSSADVLSSWGAPGSDGWLQPEMRQLVASVVAVTPRVLGIRLRDDGAETPRSLAEAALAIASRRSGVSWPLGTTGFLVIDHRRGSFPEAGVITMTQESAVAVGGAGVEMTGRFRFLIAPGTDPRDRLDERVDLLVSRDPSVLAYAATLPNVTSEPLPWLRTHVLLSPARAQSSRVAPPPSAIPPATRAMLATDAVRGEARGAQGPFWWGSSGGCTRGSAAGRPRSAAASGGTLVWRVVYPASDPVAGELSARLVALAAFDEPQATRLLEDLFPAGATGLVSAGLAEPAFEATVGA